MFAGPPVSTSMDFDESVFGPLHRHHTSRDAGREQGREIPVHALGNQTNSHDMTQYNESILAPIRNANKRVCHEPEARESDESILVPARNELLAQGNIDQSVLAPIGAAKMQRKSDHRDGTLASLRKGNTPILRQGDERTTTRNPISHEPLSQGEDNERILALAKDASKKEKVCGDPSSCSAQGPVMTRRKSAFETMMASLEKSSGGEGME